MSTQGNSVEKIEDAVKEQWKKERIGLYRDLEKRLDERDKISTRVVVYFTSFSSAISVCLGSMTVRVISPEAALTRRRGPAAAADSRETPSPAF